jgi:hypothetical protein
MSGGIRLAAVLTALALGGTAAGLTDGRPSVAAPTSRSPAGAPAEAPVVARTVACPEIRHDGRQGRTTVLAATADAGTSLTSGPLRDGAPAALPPGPVASVPVDGASALVVAASGPAAGALVADQATRATRGPRRGLAVLSCPAPSTSAWFVGAGTSVGSSSLLLLVNVDAAPAEVDVALWTPDGPAQPPAGRGLRIAPGERLAVPLDRLAPGHDLLALHVATTRGRIAAAVRTASADGRTPLGTDWLPPGLPPARELVVPGLPAGPGRRVLVLANPGEQDAVTSVELTTGDGQYVPDALGELVVPAGSTVAHDLSELLATTPAAVRVRSDGSPLLAGAVVVDSSRRGRTERAFAAAAPGLSGTALLSAAHPSRATGTTLLLSAPDDAATVELRAVAPDGDDPPPVRVEVPVGTTVAVRLSEALPTASAVRLRPLSGTVYAARYLREDAAAGPLTALLPVHAARLTVVRPVVLADPGAGV